MELTVTYRSEIVIPIRAPVTVLFVSCHKKFCDPIPKISASEHVNVDKKTQQENKNNRKNEQENNHLV